MNFSFILCIYFWYEPGSRCLGHKVSVPDFKALTRKDKNTLKAWIKCTPSAVGTPGQEEGGKKEPVPLRQTSHRSNFTG